MTKVTKISTVIKVIIRKDFPIYDSEVLNKLQACGAVCALGVSLTGISKKECIEVIENYAVAGAEAFPNLATHDGPFRLTPGRFSSLYSLVKGESEALLSEARIFNPCLLADAAGPGFLHCPTEPLGPFLVRMALGKYEAQLRETGVHIVT
ncbi:hypothetical protein V8C37DRAFT_413438 [Trichoderma ceciliae]